MAKNKTSFSPAAGLFEQGAKKLSDSTAEQPVPATAIMTLENTQGRKGQKLPRINMAFTPENHQYIKKVSRQAGMSVTQYINNLIDADRNNNV